MAPGERAEAIQGEIDALRPEERTPENEAKMRKLVDERDRAKADAGKEAERKEKEAAGLAEKKEEFLHRNDTDAQRMSAIGKQLAAAGAKGDQAKVLELMMSGEELAGGYLEDEDQPKTKRQQRRAERKAEREQKAARTAARTLKKQMGEIEEGWKSGKGGAQEAMEKMAAGGNAYALEKISERAARGSKSAREMAARLTSDKSGVPSAIQNKDGKLVQVKGQDRTNQLLETIAKAIA